MKPEAMNLRESKGTGHMAEAGGKKGEENNDVVIFSFQKNKKKYEEKGKTEMNFLLKVTHKQAVEPGLDTEAIFHSQTFYLFSKVF